MELSYAFAIFFITIGPLKVIPSFYMNTIAKTEESIKALAFRAVLYSFIILLLVAVVADRLFHVWKVSLPAFILAGGLMLFLSSYNTVKKFKGVSAPALQNNTKEITALSNDEIHVKALSPISVPIIISPIGLVAVVAVVSIAHLNHSIMEVIGLMLVIMLLNFVSMIFAKYIMHKVGFVLFSIVGWIFAILQAGLGVQFVVNSIHRLFGV